MEITELYYPQIEARVGSYSFDQGVEIEVFSSQDSYFDWAKVRFTEQYQPKISLNKKDQAVINLGYNNSFEEVFSGYVAQGYDGGGFANEVNLKDDMLLLEETTINNTFLNTTPQEMISYFLSQAGVTKMKLSAQGYPERKQVPIRKMNVIQAINAVHAAWGIRKKFFFFGGMFYWGERPEQKKVYAFEYGVNILGLTRAGGVWELETVSAPFVKHSHNINVIHPQVSGEFEVKKVVSTTNDSGFIRTKIYF
ncbi:MAG: serine/arginine repetitive matrix protein 2 [Limosilactobacillus fermentum]|nr:MAG: serine/arginine repetitive matrix protein 2 [Limosilactobacillus fermentum]